MLLATTSVGLGVGLAVVSREQGRTLAEYRRAESNFRVALRAIDDYMTQVGDNRLLNEPGMQPLRKELLESATKFYRQLLGQRPGNRGLEVELGQAYYRLGIITHLTDSVEESRAAFQQALTILRMDLATNPTDPALRQGLALTLNELGNLQRETGTTKEAERDFEEAIELWDGLLVEDHPDARYGRAKLAQNYNDLAIVRRELGEHEAAERLYQQAIGQWGRLLEADPASADSRRGLAQAHGNLASLLFQRGDFAAEAEEAAKALAHWRRLNADRPKSLYYREQLASALNGLGMVKHDHLRDGKGAEPLFREALEIWRPLAEANPDVSRYQNGLAKSYQPRRPAPRPQGSEGSGRSPPESLSRSGNGSSTSIPP